MKRKLLTIYVVTLLLLIPLLPLTAFAAETPAFSLTLSNDKPAAGDEVTVTVKGKNLQDVYAYEVNLSYDETQLKFVSAKSAIEGFSVPAIQKKNLVQFASTKMGNVPGESGEVTLCTLIFKAAGAGKASMELTALKLVNSRIVSNQLKPGTLAAAEIAPRAFTDLAGHWAKAAIERAAKLGFVDGYEDGSFQPEGHVTRAEFAAMLARAQHWDTGDSAQPGFADHAGIPEWAIPSINAAVRQSVVNGYEDGTFRAERQITRAEITVMIERSLELSLNTASAPGFSDDSDIPDWAVASIAAAREAKLVQGRDGNVFVPNDPTTRAEAVTLILSMLDYRK
ncbi:S-layer homology domain-containing protein [Paenibacillus sp. GCM10023248]|uniref:S-layer homology domain-containing protein n=1 Tax=unclassified Paenibacillus TaxID=185978 RepID=UPI00237836B3|nr:S-layer homology domain-containing protein [Paenibacillus sp. MAHUQ-63]MDD9268121.1 S-layer homology domain-containing protein [Paenibacillus sp. MAHUQ-63]